nr:hypothetical protein BaRGS_016644 [Batillaria attramentaria]
MSESNRSKSSLENPDFFHDEDSNTDHDHFADDESVFSDDSDAESVRVAKKRGKKRKVPFSDEEAEKKRVLANSQERERMNRLNRALNNLRKALPAEYSLYNRRLSKIRTLRLAINYIKGLSEMLQQDYTPSHTVTYPAMQQQQQQQQQPFYPVYPQKPFISPAFVTSPHFSASRTPGDEGYFSSFSDSHPPDSSFLASNERDPARTDKMKRS